MNNWFFYLVLALFVLYLVFLVRYWLIRKRLELGQWKPGLNIDRVRVVFWATMAMFFIGILFFAHAIYDAIPQPEPTRIAVSPDVQPSPVTPAVTSTPIENYPIATPVLNETKNSINEAGFVIMLVLGLLVVASPLMDWILKAVFSLSDEEYAAGARGLPYGRRRDNDRS